jgi:predicted nucleotidyltransferase
MRASGRPRSRRPSPRSKLDERVRAIAEELQSRFGCHTVILYGSRARGDAVITSDYDLIGWGERLEPVREARWDHGAFLDLFVYPDLRLEHPEDYLHLVDGRVILERDGSGTRLLAQVAELARAAPEPMAEDEARVRRVWYAKMIERCRRGDAEGNYRRVWLLYSLLEDYYSLRGLRYRGPKQALQQLQKEQPDTYRHFCLALEPGADVEAIQKLASRVGE